MMLTKVLSLLLLFALPFGNAASQNTDSGTILGCTPPKETRSSGFEVAYYHYPMAIRASNPKCFTYDTTYKSTAYQYGGYETYGGGLIDRSYGVTNLTFRSVYKDACSTPHAELLPSNYNYNTPITTTNFSMLITGYFYAPKSGSYEFILDYIDDLSYMNVGAGRAFNCCEKEASVANPAPFDLSVMWPQTTNTATVYLLGGYYYPLRIFFINREGVGGLTVTFKDPDGVVHNTFDGFIFSASDGKECPVPVRTTTLPWDGTYTTSYTTVGEYTDDSGSTVTENVIVVETPEVHTATTEYSGWTGKFTSTYATKVITTTGSNGIPTISTIYSVETPEVQTATTEFSGWTGKVTTTHGTEVVTATGSDGIPTIKSIYSVETPEVQTATTEYSGWTGTTTNTIGTETVTETGSNGIPTIKTIFTVETPEVQTATTTYTPWTGATTNTIGTETVTETGSDGIPTIKTIFTVETPEVQTDTTTYTPWTGATTNTIGTETVTETGSDGIPTIKTIFTVETPEVQTATTEYSGWTGTTTNTIGTETVTETGSDGIPTVKTIYTVETPEGQTATTAYTPWTGSVTQTIGTETVQKLDLMAFQP